jgi:hypothetical protein
MILHPLYLWNSISNSVLQSLQRSERGRPKATEIEVEIEHEFDWIVATARCVPLSQISSLPILIVIVVEVTSETGRIDDDPDHDNEEDGMPHRRSLVRINHPRGEIDTFNPG